VGLIKSKSIKDAHPKHFRFMYLILPHQWTVDGDSVVVMI